ARAGALPLDPDHLHHHHPAAGVAAARVLVPVAVRGAVGVGRGGDGARWRLSRRGGGGGILREVERCGSPSSCSRRSLASRTPAPTKTCASCSTRRSSPGTRRTWPATWA